MPYCDRVLSVAAAMRRTSKLAVLGQGQAPCSTNEFEFASAAAFSASQLSAEARSSQAEAGR